MYQGWTETLGSVSLLSFAFQANYHFTKLDASKFDLYAGAELGYGLYNVTYDSGISSGISGSSGLVLAPVFGGPILPVSDDRPQPEAHRFARPQARFWSPHRSERSS